MTAVSRLMRELKEARRPNNTAETDGIELSADDDRIFSWRASIAGPADTPFAGGIYKLALRIPPDYPMSPPAATMTTRVFHPNVKFDTGEICLDILKAQWSPAWTLANVCRAIQLLLASPAADSPLNCDAGNLIRAGDVVGFESLARWYAVKEAGAAPSEW